MANNITALLTPCLRGVGAERGYSKQTAKSFGFCGNSSDGFCPMWHSCNGVEEPVLSWYTGQVRLQFRWYEWNAYAYSEAQAIKLLRDSVGYRCRLGTDDFVIRCVRELTDRETIVRKCELRINK